MTIFIADLTGHIKTRRILELSQSMRSLVYIDNKNKFTNSRQIHCPINIYYKLSDLSNTLLGACQSKIIMAEGHQCEGRNHSCKVRRIDKALALKTERKHCRITIFKCSERKQDEGLQEVQDIAPKVSNNK